MASSITFEGPAADVTALANFLAAHKPSTNAHSEDGWYWVRVPAKAKGGYANAAASETFEKEGAELVKVLGDECVRIKAEAPVRANKSKRLKSQKELRELEHSKFNEAVEELAKRTGVIAGKWLFYYPQETIDGVWEKVARALGTKDGALAKDDVPCSVVKVASAAEDSATYLICVYCDDSWDKDKVEKLLKVLVKDLGLVPSAYKTDANTILGIGSKHPSQIRSSLWTKNDFMTKEEISEAMEAKSKAKEVKRKTLAEEEADGGFDPLSDSEDEKPKKKKGKND